MSDSEEVTAMQALKEEIKAVVFAKVYGNCPEKGCYYCLVAVALLLFSFSAVGIMAKSMDPVVEVTIGHMDSIPFPAFYTCWYSAVPEAPEGGEGCLATFYQLPQDSVEVREEDMKKTCLQADNTTHPMLGLLKKRFPEHSCSVYNTDGKAMARGLDSIIFLGTQHLPENGSGAGNQSESERFYRFLDHLDFENYFGFWDPHAAAEDQSDIEFYQFSFYSMNYHFGFRADHYTDDTGNTNLPGMQFGEPKSFYKYELAATQSPNRLYHVPGRGLRNVSGMIRIVRAGPLVRQVVTRHKYFSEVWAQIGGAWAAAAMITTLFFQDKSFSSPDSSGPAETWKLPRLRPARSRRELAEQLGSLLRGDAEAAKGEAEAEGAAESGCSV
mmetsp:Transcript_73256/g.236918  ORF Transcript_73256/g.236918 Transcript_73256/m.236918 type:complete len:384 (-) Transcript_73256:132-1283(-)